MNPFHTTHSCASTTNTVMAPRNQRSALRQSTTRAWLRPSLSLCLAATVALLSIPFGYGQIDDAELSELIATLQSDDYDARHEARMTLQDHVSQASAPNNDSARLAVERQLLNQVDAELPETTRLWLLRQIALIGSDVSVDTLASLLRDPNDHIADAARRALEDNPSPRASEALLAGLQAAENERHVIGYISSLTRRKYAEAIETVARHLDSDNRAVADMATMSLGQFETKEARAALLDFHASKARPDQRRAIELAIIRGERDFDVLSELVQNGSSRAVRSAAFQQAIDRNTRRAARLLRDIIKDDKLPHRGDLIRIAMTSGEGSLERTAFNRLRDQDPAEQAVLLGALPADRSKGLERRVLKVVPTADEPVKIQAIEALGRVGSVNSLPLLLETLEDRSRDVREAGEDAIAAIDHQKIDRKLIGSAKRGKTEKRLTAIKALGFRYSEDATKLVDEIVRKKGDPDLRREALATMERIGTVESFPILVDLIVSEDEDGLRRYAQRTLRRLSLRTEDPDRAWTAFNRGFQQAAGDEDARLALIAVIDSAPTKEAIDYLVDAWRENDKRVQEAILRVLPSWRNWDGGFTLLEFAAKPGASDELRETCYNGIGRLILGSDGSYSFDGKFDLANLALEEAESESERQAVLRGFRYSTWRERIYVNQNKVSPELKEAVLEFAD